MIRIEIKRLKHSDGLALPKQMTVGSSGADISAAVDEDITLKSGEYKLIPTGLSMAIPQGYEVQIRPRSGLAAKHGVTVLNTPGTIDADYRGEVKIILINLGSEDFVISRGERIAQAVVAEVPRVEYIEVDELDSTDRGEGGFGHTGKSH